MREVDKSKLAQVTVKPVSAASGSLVSQASLSRICALHQGLEEKELTTDGLNRQRKELHTTNILETFGNLRPLMMIL
ncbi:hypothetical protein RRG08_037619 [Elysia crispata]|uniref:Uncharacterized protein n=1 Tax=Elysia crispata TaxID=231223 RepID=A0AAE0YH15_9GAST|nr:hypothetical protein RRG08_037619 [Elysia crispata]